MILPRPRVPYPPPPVTEEFDEEGRRRFHACLQDDITAFLALESVLRPLDLHSWTDPASGRLFLVLGRPLGGRDVAVAEEPLPGQFMVTKEAPTPTLTGEFRCLGNGDPAGAEEGSQGKGQVYRSVTHASTISPSASWLAWFNFHGIESGAPGIQRSPALDYVTLEEGSSLPLDTAMSWTFPLAVGEGSSIQTIAMGAPELRHTPFPIFIPSEGEEGVAEAMTMFARVAAFEAEEEGGEDENIPLSELLNPGSGSGSGHGPDSGSGSGSGAGSPSGSGSGSGSGSSGSSGSGSGSGSSGSSGSDSSSSSVSKIILPINRDGRLVCIGWCAVEGAEEQWETVITAEVKGRASFPLPETYFANLRPDSVHVVSAHANSGQAHALCARIEDNTLHAEVVCAETGRPIAARLTVLVRGATARSEGPWPLGPYSRIEESRRFHAATRQHR